MALKFNCCPIGDTTLAGLQLDRYPARGDHSTSSTFNENGRILRNVLTCLSSSYVLTSSYGFPRIESPRVEVSKVETFGLLSSGELSLRDFIVEELAGLLFSMFFSCTVRRYSFRKM